jgi:hypothetical protein
LQDLWAENFIKTGECPTQSVDLIVNFTRIQPLTGWFSLQYVFSAATKPFHVGTLFTPMFQNYPALILKMEYPQQTASIVNDLLLINDEIIRAYDGVLRKENEKALKSIFERIIQECGECKKELMNFLPVQVVDKKNGKHYLEWKGVRINGATKNSMLVFSANDVLAVMNVCFSGLTSTEIDPGLRELLATQQARLSKLYFHIEQFHDAQ